VGTGWGREDGVSLEKNVGGGGAPLLTTTRIQKPQVGGGGGLGGGGGGGGGGGETSTVSSGSVQEVEFSHDQQSGSRGWLIIFAADNIRS